MTTPKKDTSERKTINQEDVAHELALDLLHQSLENDPRPDETVMLTMITAEGKRVGLILPSLRERKRIYPSSEERRNLLSLLLGVFPTQAGA